jgi:hypothetical protein
VRERISALVPYLELGSRVIVSVFLILAATAFLIHSALSVAYRYPLDYGEAPMVDQARRLLEGETLYRPDLSTPPYTISNYPPLYPLTLVPVLALFGPSFAFGRFLSVASAAATALALAGIVRIQTRQRTAAWVTGMAFLSWPYVLEWSGRARVDLLALALSTWALYVVVRWPGERRKTIVAGLLLVAAVYTRQSYGLAAPLAAAVWLWARCGWREALRLVAVVALVGLALLLLLMVTTGGGFWTHVVTANVNAFSFDRVMHHARNLRDAAPLLLVVGGATVLLGPGQLAAWPLVAPYLLGAVGSGVTIGKVGSNINYLLELCAALSLSAGLLVAWMGRDDGAPRTTAGLWRAVLGALLAVGLAAQAGTLVRTSLQGPVQTLKGRLSAETPLSELEALVAATDGTILADEYMGLLTLQGRAIALEPFEMTQLVHDGVWDQRPLLARIRSREFPLIMIHHFRNWPVYKERWTPEMLGEILTSYEATRFMAETLVFEPRSHRLLSTDEACPGAPWAAPTTGDFGVWWVTRELAFMGEGTEGTLPVRAVADGWLLRRPEWHDAVAILHENPLGDGGMVWTFYGNMGGGSEGGSLVNPAFPPGTEGMPVTKGDRLGYQGRLWGREIGWVHLRFAVVPALDDGGFPDALLGLPVPEGAPPVPVELRLLDPAPYLGTPSSPVMGVPVWLPYRCVTPGGGM